MLTLANYLTQHNIRFHFDPAALGLSKDIKIKYFLHEFMIDSDRKMLSFKEVEQEIMEFFQAFRSRYQKNEETSTDYSDRKSADSAMLLNRLELISKRESWDCKQKGLTTDRSKKNLMLSEKIEHSKKKSM
jgi:Lon protease-like protein